MKIPSCSNAPERTPAVVGAEHRRTIEAQTEIQQVALIVRVVGSTGDT